MKDRQDFSAHSDRSIRSVLSQHDPLGEGKEMAKRQCCTVLSMFQFPVERGIEWSSLTCHAVLLLGRQTRNHILPKLLAFAIHLGNINILRY